MDLLTIPTANVAAANFASTATEPDHHSAASSAPSDALYSPLNWIVPLRNFPLTGGFATATHLIGDGEFIRAQLLHDAYGICECKGKVLVLDAGHSLTPTDIEYFGLSSFYVRDYPSVRTGIDTQLCGEALPESAMPLRDLQGSGQPFGQLAYLQPRTQLDIQTLLDTLLRSDWLPARLMVTSLPLAFLNHFAAQGREVGAFEVEYAALCTNDLLAKYGPLLQQRGISQIWAHSLSSFELTVPDEQPNPFHQELRDRVGAELSNYCHFGTEYRSGQGAEPMLSAHACALAGAARE